MSPKLIIWQKKQVPTVASKNEAVSNFTGDGIEIPKFDINQDNPKRFSGLHVVKINCHLCGNLNVEVAVNTNKGQ